MSKISRFGVSLNKDLLAKFDKLVKNQKCPTRSKAIENLIASSISKDNLSNDNTSVIGTINIIYDHHKRELLRELTDVQHDWQENIVSSQHIHINHCDCFEIITIRGLKKDIEKLFAGIKSIKGIKNSSLNMLSL